MFYVCYYLCRGEEDESLAIKPPQQMARKEKSHHRKEEKRKDKRRHRSHSAEGGMESLLYINPTHVSDLNLTGLEMFQCICIRSVFGFLQQGNMFGLKKKKKTERAIAGSASGKKTKPGETGSVRNEGNRPELIHAERGEHWPWKGKTYKMLLHWFLQRNIICFYYSLVIWVYMFLSVHRSWHIVLSTFTWDILYKTSDVAQNVNCYKTFKFIVIFCQMQIARY